MVIPKTDFDLWLGVQDERKRALEYCLTYDSAARRGTDRLRIERNSNLKLETLVSLGFAVRTKYRAVGFAVCVYDRR